MNRENREQTMLIQTLDTLGTEYRSLIGRSRELGEITRLMSRSRLLTLTGIIGVGKSSLAVAVARYRKAAFPNGVVVVDFDDSGPGIDAFGDLRVILAELDRVNGGPSAPGYPNDRNAADALVVLDNCENAIEDAALLVNELLSACRNVRILATSQQILQLPGEVVYTVRPLVDDASELFLDRVSELDLDPDRGWSDPTVIAEICAELDGLPAVIELAADGVRDMSPLQMLLRIRSEDDASVSALDGSDLVETALAQCSQGERTICIELAAIQGSFGLETAEYIFAEHHAVREPVVDVIAALLDRSILAKADDDARTRYTLPRIFQRYGRRRLSQDPGNSYLMSRLATWYRDAVGRAAAEFFTGHQLEWLRFLKAEMPNIAAVLDYCIAERQDVPTGLELATSLAPYWPAVGDQLDLIWLIDALKLYEPADARRGAGLVAASRIAMRSARTDVARAVNDELRNLLVENADPGLRLEYIEVTALARLYDGQTADAVPLLERARAGYEAAEDEAGTWRTTTCLAFATCKLGREEQSRAHLDTSLALVSAAGAEWSRSTSLSVAAFQQWQRRRVDKAADLAREALAINETAGDRAGKAVCLELLAWTATLQNQHKKAARLLGAAATVTEQPVQASFPCAGLGHGWCVERLVRAIGEQAYAHAYQTGAKTSLDEAMQVALKARSNPSKLHPQDTHPLTPREFEIARGIALGKTNREIASSLAVAQRTAEAHLEHILTKLNLTSRAQVAAWIASHDGTEGRSGAPVARYSA